MGGEETGVVKSNIPSLGGFATPLDYQTLFWKLSPQSDSREQLSPLNLANICDNSFHFIYNIPNEKSKLNIVGSSFGAVLMMPMMKVKDVSVW